MVTFEKCSIKDFNDFTEVGRPVIEHVRKMVMNPYVCTIKMVYHITFFLYL